MKKAGWIAVASCFALLAAGVAGPAAAQDRPVVKVGSKGFTEQLLLGNMVALLLEDRGFKVEKKIGLGGTVLCHEALVRGDINVYVEYTGTGLVTLLKQKPVNEPEEAYRIVKKEYEDRFKLAWLSPWGFNNTYCIVLRKADAEKMNLKKVSDLKSVAHQLVFGGTIEFIARPDGVPGISKHYGLKFKDTKGMDPGLVYKAIAEKQVDVISGFATDGRIPQFQLVVLQDDLKFWPPYFAAPVVRQDLLAKAPQVADILNQLAGRIGDETMAGLNFEVDGKKKSAEAVAQDYLKGQKLIK